MSRLQKLTLAGTADFYLRIYEFKFSKVNFLELFHSMSLCSFSFAARLPSSYIEVTISQPPINSPLINTWGIVGHSLNISITTRKQNRWKYSALTNIF